MSHRSRLRALLRERSVRTGDFTLASGARSSYYVDARPTTMSAEGQFLVGHVSLDVIERAGLDVTWVGGMTMGADPVAFAIAHRSWERGTPLRAFSVRKEPKDHGTGQRVEGGLPPGARVLVVEDSITTGGSILDAIEALTAHGAEVVAVLALVDREEGGRERLEEAGHALHVVFPARELLGESDP